MTQNELAKIVQSSQSHLSNILRGFRIPSHKLMQKLILAYRDGQIPFEDIKPFLNKSTSATKLALLTTIIDENNFDKSLSLAIDRLIVAIENTTL